MNAYYISKSFWEVVAQPWLMNNYAQLCIIMQGGHCGPIFSD